MKLHHLPAAFAHSPLFVMRHAPQMLADTFAGTSLRSIVGLEDEQAVFNRYQQRRKNEASSHVRQYQSQIRDCCGWERVQINGAKREQR